MSKLSHFNEQGEAHMVDVGDKAATQRLAVADGLISMQPETLKMVKQGRHSKGDVIAVARIAGIMGAKKTSELIPLCHPLFLTKISMEFDIRESDNTIYCRATVQTHGSTGVEMEALTAVQIALLTIYDMCKAIDRGMTMKDIGVVLKEGGKSGRWQRL